MTSVSALSAGVRLSPLIRNHMVLQRSSATAVWGTASPGERILVQLENACAETIAASDGSWIVHLNLQSVPGNGPFSMTVQGKNTIQVRDILLGEVWIAAGQSNMAKIIGPYPNQFPCINWEDASASRSENRSGSFMSRTKTPLLPSGISEPEAGKSLRRSIRRNLPRQGISLRNG